MGDSSSLGARPLQPHAPTNPRGPFPHPGGMPTSRARRRGTWPTGEAPWEVGMHRNAACNCDMKAACRQKHFLKITGAESTIYPRPWPCRLALSVALSSSPCRWPGGSGRSRTGRVAHVGHVRGLVGRLGGRPARVWGPCMAKLLGIANRGSSPRLILRKINDLRSGDAALFVASLSVLIPQNV